MKVKPCGRTCVAEGDQRAAKLQFASQRVKAV